jgi:hypothetical protein
MFCMVDILERNRSLPVVNEHFEMTLENSA